MKQRLRILKSLFLFTTVTVVFFYCSGAFAISSDMAIKVSKPTEITPPNSISTVSITIRNLGPDETFAFFLVTSVFPSMPTSLFQPIEYTLQSGPCRETFADLLPGDTFGEWTSPILSAGGSITCSWMIEVDAEPSDEPITVTWFVAPNGGGLNIDPNHSNNTDSLVFAFNGTPSIPILIKPTAAFLMLVLLLMGLRQIAIRD